MEGRKKDPAAVELGRKGGLKGGPARVAKTTSEQRREWGRKAAEARWGTRHNSGDRIAAQRRAEAAKQAVSTNKPEAKTFEWTVRYGDVFGMFVYDQDGEGILSPVALWDSQWKIYNDPFDLEAELTRNRFKIYSLPFEEMDDWDDVAPTFGPTKGYFPTLLIDELSYVEFPELGAASYLEMSRDLKRQQTFCEGAGNEAEEGPDGKGLCFTCLERVVIDRYGCLSIHRRWDETEPQYEARLKAIKEVGGKYGRTRPPGLPVTRDSG